MEAVFYTGIKTLEYREVPDPVPGENEYLVQVEACGICGSDYEGYLGKTGRRIPPMIMGHECAGVIKQAPKNGKYAVGTRVCIFPNYFCGECKYCKQGKTLICDNAVFLGILSDNGAMCRYITAKEEFLLPFSEKLSFEEAAMTEPLAVTLEAVRKLSDEEIKNAEFTVLVGCGPIGMMVLLLLKARGARNIIVSDTYDYRLNLAKELGASYVINPTKEDFETAIKNITDGKMCDLAFEAVGFSATANSSIIALQPGGKAVWIGNGVAMVEINMQRIVTTELTVIGSHIYSLDTFRDALGMLEQGVVDVKPLITDYYPLAQTPEAFQLLENNKEGKTLKVMPFCDLSN